MAVDRAIQVAPAQAVAEEAVVAATKDLELLTLQLNFHIRNLISDNDFSFSDRLARENGWSDQYTLEVIEEYKRFLALLIIQNQNLTPSDEVDQAWHLHLQYSRSYAKMCQDVAGKFLHHEPTKGGVAEDTKFDEWYERTKVIYSITFGSAPPKSIWPDAKTRFTKSPKAVRVNYEDNVIMSKTHFRSMKRMVFVAYGLMALAVFFAVVQI